MKPSIAVRVLIIAVAMAAVGVAWATGIVGGPPPPPQINDPQFVDQNGSAVRVRTNDAGEMMVRLDADEIAVLPDGGVIPVGPQDVNVINTPTVHPQGVDAGVVQTGAPVTSGRSP